MLDGRRPAQRCSRSPTGCRASSPCLALSPAGRVRLQPARLCARRVCAAYVARFATRRRRRVLVGMNPGPFGHGADGRAVRQGGERSRLARHPRADRQARARSIEAARRRIRLSSRRGQRAAAVGLGAAAASARPDAFFERFFVANSLPAAVPRGLRPQPAALDKLARDEQRAIAAPLRLKRCGETVRQLAPRCVLGIGRFAERRAGVALGA